MNDLVALVAERYAVFKDRHEKARAHFKRPLTLTHKILAGHMEAIEDENGALVIPGTSV